jgi:filamentous hemagglutinin family protein
MKYVAIATLASLSLLTEVAQAQVASDGTLSTTVNSIDGRNFVIEDGDRAGNNLFHSFQEFSVPTGGSARFNNSGDIENIFSRVTGGSISNIDGLIQANGRANLFLLNPNGIIFGSNTQLNIGGSFISSTATHLRFADGTVLDTRSPTPSLLTLSVPIGLQMGRDGGAIQVNGLGNRESVPTQFGLVTTGSTLGLVGNQVTLNGGVVGAIGGRLEVGAVTDGVVSLTPTSLGFRFGYDSRSSFGDIALLNRSTLWNPSGDPLGGIQVQGRNLRLNDSDIAVAVTPGSAWAGGITIQAAESLRLEGNNLTFFPFSSAISSLVPGDAIGNSGDIQVTAPQLEIENGARIHSVTLGQGASGNIIINADRIRLNGYVPINDRAIQQQIVSSQISSVTLGTGNSGRIQIESDRLELRNGARIFAAVTEQATGAGGDIQISASVLRARGGNRLSLLSGASGIYSSTASSGAGGNLRISGDRLFLEQQSLLSATASRTGDGGNLSIEAPFIFAFQNSDIIANAEQGMGGNIAISTEGIFGTAYRPELTSESDITASSQFGLSGSVSITTPNTQINSDLVELPSNVGDAPQIAQSCREQSDSRFVITGRSGLPETPYQGMTGDRPWSDLRNLSIVPTQNSSQTHSPTDTASLVEATTLYHNATTGNVELVAAQALPTEVLATCAGSH